MEPQPLIDFYCRKGWYRQVQTLCHDLMRQRGDDPTLGFWRGVGLSLEGSGPDAVRVLQDLHARRDVEFPVTAALIHAHQKCDLVDTEEVNRLQQQLSVSENMAGESSVLLAANYYWHEGNIRAALRLLDRLLDSGSALDDATMTPLERRAMVLRSWVQISVVATNKSERDARKAAAEYFIGQAREARRSRQNQPELLIMMGHSRACELQRNTDGALDELSRVSAVYQWYTPAMYERARILLKRNDWDQASDTVQRVLDADSNDIEALRIQVLILLACEARPADAASRIQDLVNLMGRLEPRNAQLYYDLSRPFARLAGHNHAVLQATLLLAERATELDPKNSKFKAELGYQKVLAGDYARAEQCYREASQLEQGNLDASQGIILVQIKQGKFDEAHNHMEFLSVISETVGGSSELAYLQALLAWRKDRSLGTHMRLLNDARDIHIRDAKQPEPVDAFDFFVRFNPTMLVDMAHEYLQHASGSSGFESGGAFESGVQLLELVTDRAPGLLEPQIALAKARLGASDIESASRTLTRVLQLNPLCSEAHLAMAQVRLKQEEYSMASESLEEALSHDFAMAQSPVYKLVRAQVAEARGELAEALQVLEGAMNLSGVRTAIGANANTVALTDRVELFIQYADLLAKNSREEEARQVLATAADQFADTAEGVRVAIADAELAVRRGDVDQAVRMLSSIAEDSVAYPRAQMVKANIFLQHRHDKRQYAQCFRDLATRDPSVSSFVNLGDAYMRIQMPDEAIRSFEQALDLNPMDAALASKIGQALVTTHDYVRAIDYYEQAMNNAPNSAQLQYELSGLYLKLRKYDQAARSLADALSADQTEDVPTMQNDVRTLLLLADVHQGNVAPSQQLQALMQARTMQGRIMEKQRSDPAVRSKMAAIAYKIGSFHEEDENFDAAQQFFNEALRHNDAHEDSMLALAKLHLRAGELDNCQYQCHTLLRINKGNEEAAMMLADLTFRKNDHDTAMFHFTELLDAKPNHYVALSRLIGLLRKAGKLEDAAQFITNAENANPRAAHHVGLHFCKGLLARYNNSVRDAVAEFNLCRRDAEWGAEALVNMVEIYTNPDKENLWEGGEDEVNTEGLRTAERLLRELAHFEDAEITRRRQVLEGYHQLASKARGEVEQAIQRFIDILEVNRDYVPALLGMATAFMIQRAAPKARNQLKRISKMPYDQDRAEEFEKAYLMLADIYVERGKMDLALELCKRCLSYNRSCGKAWALMGLIMEKEASYVDAADHYQQAFKLENEASAPLGFRFAFNLLKAQRFVEAIDICHKVLLQYPDYPRIEREILHKARQGLRP